MLKTKKNFTEGPLFFRILWFALPIMLTGVLQIVYSMADNIVVGQFSGDPYALAAVGSTSSLTNLVINILLGISAGTGVVVAQYYGAKEYSFVNETVHTAITFSAIGGVAVALLGLAISEPVLALMGTKSEVMAGAVLYFRIICFGIPASSMYNFGASILRSIGNSKTPLIILASSGIANVLLNLFFVIVCDMSVSGVATATIISQYLSAAAVLFVLYFKRSECYGFTPKRLRIHKRHLMRMLRYGIPAGIQGSMFSLSNVFITGAVNSFSTPDPVTAYTIANNIDAISYTVMNAFAQAAMTFSGQNYGAGKRGRINKVLLYSLIQVMVVGTLVTRLQIYFGETLAGFYMSSDLANRESVMSITIEIIGLLLNTYFICGLLDVVGGTLRGIGYSLSPMIVNIVGICGVRMMYIFLFFPMEDLHTPIGLMYCYPISWTVALIAMATIRIIAGVKLKKLMPDKSDSLSTDAVKTESGV